MFRQLLAVALTGLAACASIAHAAPKVYEFTFDSDAYPIDQIYRSMKGPKGRKVVQLMDEGLAAELIWVVGYRTEIVEADGDAVLSGEFMCHNNLNLAELDRHAKLFNWPRANPRLFTLSQGQMEVRFPEGFGIPIHSHEKLAANHTVARQLVQSEFEKKPLAEWVERFHTLQGQWTVVQNTLEVAADPQARANGYMQETRTREGTPFELVATPVQFDGEPSPTARAPEFNEHGDELLLELGLEMERILELKAGGAIS